MGAIQLSQMYWANVWCSFRSALWKDLINKNNRSNHSYGEMDDKNLVFLDELYWQLKRTTVNSIKKISCTIQCLQRFSRGGRQYVCIVFALCLYQECVRAFVVAFSWVTFQLKRQTLEQHGYMAQHKYVNVYSCKDVLQVLSVVRHCSWIELLLKCCWGSRSSYLYSSNPCKVASITTQTVLLGSLYTQTVRVHVLVTICRTRIEISDCKIVFFLLLWPAHQVRAYMDPVEHRQVAGSNFRHESCLSKLVIRVRQSASKLIASLTITLSKTFPGR